MRGCQLSSLPGWTTAAASCDPDTSANLVMTNVAMTHPGVEVTAAYFPGEAVDTGFLLLPPQPALSGQGRGGRCKGNLTQATLLLHLLPTPRPCLFPAPQPPGTLLQCRGSVTPASAVLHGSSDRGLPLPFSLPPAPPASNTIHLLVSGLALPSITNCLSTLSFTSPDSSQGRQLGQAVTLLNPRRACTLALRDCAGGLELCWFKLF